MADLLNRIAWRRKLLCAAACLMAPGGVVLFGGLIKHSGRAGADYHKDIRPILSQYCFNCHNDEKHKGDLSFQRYPNLDSVLAHRKTWAEVLNKLRRGEMPPEGKPQPSQRERERIIAWLDSELFPVDPAHPDPGRVTIRRLNRTEYNNTIRDLLAVDFHPADDFPADDTGYGFDNIGDVQSVSPLLLEKYWAAAEKILDAAFAAESSLMNHDRSSRATPTRPAGETNSIQQLYRILHQPPSTGPTNEVLKEILSGFARRAFRRPLNSDEVEALVSLASHALTEGATLQQSMRVSLQAILVSPHFLFRGELQSQPDNPRKVQPIDDYALASRLSYFLWSSMPDEELFGLAQKGQLRRNLAAQVRRMLQDPKSQALVENFSGQWLQLRNLNQISPDPKVFPDFDEELRAAMVKETQLLFEYLLREDRSILEFLTADYTFVNARLARHYGLPGAPATGFQRVSLKGTPRAGVLTHASVLALTSNPTRTSPVKRGKWVLESIIGQPPPPPPPGVPPLAEGKNAVAGASLRQRMEQHRQDPLCASCHARMDPIGFGLEHFDAIGKWREKDGTFDIDAAGQLQTGEQFSGAAELLAVLANRKRDEFARCLTEKMLTYALGRGLEYYDRPAVDKIVHNLARQNSRFSTLIQGVVNSVPFQMRRGESPAE